MLAPYLLIVVALIVILALSLERCEECGKFIHSIECDERNHDRFAL